MTTVILERMIYGSPGADDSPEEAILSMSDHLTPQEAALWRGLTS